jgi:hypothetical protein
MTTEYDLQDLTAPDINAESHYQDIASGNYREPNQITPLLRMFTKWHTKES